MSRPEREWLQDILDAAHEISSYVLNCSLQAFVDDSMRRNATLQQFTVIGAAAARLSADLKGLYPEIDWPVLIGFRNVIVHGYFRLTWKIVWDTATNDIPKLATRVSAILEEERNLSAEETMQPE